MGCRVQFSASVACHSQSHTLFAIVRMQAKAQAALLWTLTVHSVS
jgi:hypothetical protein